MEVLKFEKPGNPSRKSCLNLLNNLIKMVNEGSDSVGIIAATVFFDEYGEPSNNSFYAGESRDDATAFMQLALAKKSITDGYEIKKTWVGKDGEESEDDD